MRKLETLSVSELRAELKKSYAKHEDALRDAETAPDDGKQTQRRMWEGIAARAMDRANEIEQLLAEAE